MVRTDPGSKWKINKLVAAF